MQSIREEKANRRDEINNLNREVMTIKEKLASKTAKIEGIKDTLKQSAGVTDFERVLEHVQVDENQDDEEDDDDDEDYYNEQQMDEVLNVDP